jgi:hypothetical protein
MQTLPIARQLTALAWVVGAVSSANAFSLSTSGNLSYDERVAELAFTRASSTAEMPLWTDSFRSSVSSDPMRKQRAGGEFDLIGGTEDNTRIGDGQTHFDAGLRSATLDEQEHLALNSASTDSVPGSASEPDLSALLALGLGVLGWMSYRSRSA